MNHTTIDTITDALASDLDRAFPDLVVLLQDDLFSGVLRMTGRRADAEDITQETLIRAYRALSGYPEARIRSLAVRPWMWTIALNLCRNRSRSRSRKPETPLPEWYEPASPAPGPEQMAVAADAGERLGTRVAALPWAQRRAVVLRHVIGLGYQEIAEALERPVGTVKADVHRALASLRRELPTEETS
ncbi:MAG: RNA polymerase sigma factor [Actinobacteria bacterium]|nr:RNA polymerase sigma factor [Actinomycetota bacterium]MBU1494205.1 RNA polymerase sigma factor [Actinomycetota bacterium]